MESNNWRGRGANSDAQSYYKMNSVPGCPGLCFIKWGLDLYLSNGTADQIDRCQIFCFRSTHSRLSFAVGENTRKNICFVAWEQPGDRKQNIFGSDRFDQRYHWKDRDPILTLWNTSLGNPEQNSFYNMIVASEFAPLPPSIVRLHQFHRI